jgi:hypothetical protein
MSPHDRKKTHKKSKNNKSYKTTYKMTLKNIKPNGHGWKLDGTGFDLIKNRKEYFWYR